MQSVYSWMGTPLHLVLEDELAEAYNRAQDAFKQAQINFKDRNGRVWNPVNDAIFIDWTPLEHDAWDKIASLINHLIEINGGSLAISEDLVASDYFVKLHELNL